MTPKTTVLSLQLQKNPLKSNKKNTNKSNKIDKDNDFLTHIRYSPFENINESLNSSSGNNLLQSEINYATQDQINNNGRRQERKKTMVIVRFNDEYY